VLIILTVCTEIGNLKTFSLEQYNNNNNFNSGLLRQDITNSLHFFKNGCGNI